MAPTRTQQNQRNHQKSVQDGTGSFEYTSTTRVLQLGIHNTLEEIAEAQRTFQLERLSTTNAGRNILDHLGIGRSNEAEMKLPVPEEVQRQTRIDTIPRNMNP